MLYIPYPEMYQCRKCGEWKRWSLFQKNKQCPDGIERRCLECKRLHNKAWSDAHPDDVRKSRQKWNDAHPEYNWHTDHPEETRQIKRRSADKHKEENKIRNKAWAATHPEAMRQSKKKWRDANPDKQREAQKRARAAHPEVYRAIDSRYTKNHPEKARAKVQKREALKRALPATFTDADWRRCLGYWQNVCAYCGNGPSVIQKTKVLIQEHFIPVTANGPYTSDNIVPACKSCNSQKQDLDPTIWLTRHFGESQAKVILKYVQDYFDWVRSQEGQHN